MRFEAGPKKSRQFVEKDEQIALLFSTPKLPLSSSLNKAREKVSKQKKKLSETMLFWKGKPIICLAIGLHGLIFYFFQRNFCSFIFFCWVPCEHFWEQLSFQRVQKMSFCAKLTERAWMLMSACQVERTDAFIAYVRRIYARTRVGAPD